MTFIDTHCHIHESSYPLDAVEVLDRAQVVGVEKLICVGTDEKSSNDALEFASHHEGVFASIGVHPHEAKEGYGEIAKLAEGAEGQASTKLVAIGEIGLDYFYTHSPRDVQIAALEAQVQLALKLNLPIIFHVREAFDDFWPILDNFHGIRGELHSFTDSQKNLEAGLARGLYIGINGISTFTKDLSQQATFAAVPLEKMLLETDAPFLTPVPFRGRVNEPAFLRTVADYHATIRGLSVDEIAAATSANAHALFAL